MKLLTKLRKLAGVSRILSDIDTNPKVAKNGKLGILTAVLHLAPGDMSGHEVCPKRSPGCSAACLHYAGNPAYLTNKTQARIRKTKLLFADRNLFMEILALEIAEHVALAEKKNMEAAVRLNGTSDIVWERKAFFLSTEAAEVLGTQPGRTTVIDLFPDLQFYDYTALPGRTPPPNYHLTFSLKENNFEEALQALENGRNVAAVFYDALPSTYLGVPVINGDDHDYRPVDPSGVIVGLKVKGTKGRQDLTGFVRVKSSELSAAA